GPAPAVAPGAAPATPAAPAAGVGTFRVQVVAVKTLRDANPYLVRLRKAGHAPFTVTQGGFVKVRLGPYATRADAQQVADRVKAELRYKPFVVNEP
ncbi:MAG: SPOR domain-containing protein, partial [Gemmatimonadales bacterium]|nr:SPOR domain-containing protein [Gemmatimonadales bacterium]